jgi:S-layer protein (TIGR01564 family)
VLDKDAPAVGSENLIVVGGPCANTVAAALLDNPTQCTEGFEAGKAVIRAWDNGDKVAILVAGYTAQDTQGASKVLASYKDYSLSGSEVEVVVADLNSISINPMG